MSNPMFDDFIELDLLDTTETTSDMFSFYLGGASGLDDSSADLGAAAAALGATTEDDTGLAMDLVIKQEDVSDSESHLLLDPSPLNQPLELSVDAHQPALVFGESSMTLVSPDQLTIAPQATTVSPATISLPNVVPAPISADISKALSTTVSTAAATSASQSTKIYPLFNSIVPRLQRSRD